MADEMFEPSGLITLTDEDGIETEFEVIASLEIDGNVYYALMPVSDNDNGDCVILKLEEDEDGEEICLPSTMTMNMTVLPMPLMMRSSQKLTMTRKNKRFLYAYIIDSIKRKI